MRKEICIIGNAEEKRSLGRFKQKCNDVIKTDVKGTGPLDSIHLPQGRIQWQDSVHMATYT
jgi:hypothetical protein